MISVPEVVCVISCWFMLCLGLSPSSEAHDKALAAGEFIKAGHFAPKHGGEESGAKQADDTERLQPRGGKTIKGEALRVEGINYFVQGPEEKEGRLRLDATTARARNIEPGNRNEAKVKDQSYALPILLDQGVLQKRSRPVF